MIFDIVMPKMGESLTEGTVLEWKKAVGETIAKDEPLLEIATDKVDSEIPSPVSGVLVEILGEINQTYDVDTVIARVETSDVVQPTEASAPAAQSPSLPLANQPESPNKNVVSQTGASTPAVAMDDSRYYSPLVRSIAAREGIGGDELQRIPGTGFRGRVTKRDVLFYLDTRNRAANRAKRNDGLEATGLAETVDPETVEIMEMDTMRKSIARHMRHSVDTSAHVYSVSEADLTAIMAYIAAHGQTFKARHGFSLTVTHFITLAVRDALLEFPLLNASLDGSRIIRHKQLNIGIAVAVGNGLVVPPVRHAEEKSLLDIAGDISGIVQKAREKKLTLEDLEGATFSITNFGVFGNLAGYPIINQPNVAILGVGVIKKRPVVLETDQGDEIAIRQIGVLTLGFDHRLIDGAMGGRFIEAIVRNLETADPETLLAEK